MKHKAYPQDTGEIEIYEVIDGNLGRNVCTVGDENRDPERVAALIITALDKEAEV